MFDWFKRKPKPDRCVLCKKPGRPFRLGYRIDTDGHIWHTECLIEYALKDPEYIIGTPVFLDDKNLELCAENFVRYGQMIGEEMLEKELQEERDKKIIPWNE